MSGPKPAADPMVAFWAKVDASGDCWQWTGATRRGYGAIKIAGLVRQTHRLAYEALVGPIQDGLVIDHLCRNHGCVNPDHMEPVTFRENLRRGFIGRHSKRPVRGLGF